jgi:rod shape-determining protein MreD
MAFFLNLALILLFACLQLVLGRWLPQATPEILLAIIIALSFTSAILPTLWWTVVGGILLDLLPGSIVGFHLVFFAIAALVTISLSRSVFRKPSYLIVFIIALIIATIGEFLLSLIYGTITTHILVPATITAVLTVLTAVVLQRMGNQQEISSEF